MQISILRPIPDGLTVFETMRANVDGHIPLWSWHLARLRRGCAAVGFSLDVAAVERALAGLPKGAALRARLAIDCAGSPSLIWAELPPNPPIWRVAVSDIRLRADDPWLTIKSSHRPAYDAARAALPDGVDEALLLNNHGQVCEGSITNLFVQRGDKLITPPLSCGVLPGVLRATLLAQGRASEAVLTPDDLVDATLFCGNALRGLIPAVLVD